MKFALVTADTHNDNYYELNGDTDDCTQFMSWLKTWGGRSYSYDAMEKDCSILLNYDCIMLSGHPNYFKVIKDICNTLKGKVVTMFLPEGDIRLYDRYGINSFALLAYEAIKACDIIASMEEDKIPYYEMVFQTRAKFVHVPMDDRMESGIFRRPISNKSNHVLIYGDNNPNCPITVVGIAKRIKKPLKIVCVDDIKVAQIRELFGVTIDLAVWKLPSYPFLRLLGSCWLHIYPTRWVGSAREPIACAVAGTPCVGTDKSHTMKRLWPELIADVYDVDKMCSLANRLYSDIEFYQHVVDYAWKQVSFYNLENTKGRFMEAYNEAKLGWEK